MPGVQPALERLNSPVTTWALVLIFFVTVGWFSVREVVRKNLQDKLDQAGVYESNGQKQIALTVYEQVLAKDPENAKAREAIDRIRRDMKADPIGREDRKTAESGESASAPAGDRSNSH